ncbi:RHS repeat domain-containing protein [Paenibacillus sp. strain BS8-2]
MHSNNLVKQINRNGETISYAYDSRNRLTSRTTDEVTIGYTYDKAGKRLSMTDETGTTGYKYNPYTELLEEMTYPDKNTLNLQYDANGNRTQMTGPFGATTYYTHDSLNRLTTVGTDESAPDASYTYYQNGLPKQTNAGNGVNSSRTFNGMQLTGMEHLQYEAPLNSYAYGYDGNKNIINRAQNGETDNFTYDALNRTLTTSEFAEEYGYDERGNRQVMTSEQSLVPPTVMENQYDDLDRLIEVKTDDTTVQYKYNGDGLLIERTQNDETTRYYYDGDQIIAEATVVDGVAKLKAEYIRGNQMEAIAYADGTKVYPLYNGHGDVVEIRDEFGNPLNEYSYDIWGNPLTTDEKVHNPFRYSGELWDDETKLQYLRARWYDPSVGRFLNEDTYEGQIDNPLSLNLYTYVKNNPLRYIDPTGNKEFEVSPFERPTVLQLKFPSYWEGVSKRAKTVGKKIGRLKMFQEIVEEVVKSGTTATTSKFVWGKLSATHRGEFIEEYLDETEYDDWFQVGSLNGGYFPVIDFQKGNKVVSVKTIDPRLYSSSSLYSNLRSYINELSSAKIYIDKKLVSNSNKYLDIVVPKGFAGKIDISSLLRNSQGTNIRVREF